MSAIVATAGHVDHGKTELVKALTKVDTDRLEEEKRRGLTIDLGFAPLDLQKSGRNGIIDTPGHIHFIKNMLAGVGGIDLAILVVAADEGVMPQTVEHFHILRLLKIPQMVIVISKVDLASQLSTETTVEDVYRLIRGTYLEKSPVVRASSVTLSGIEELKALLDEMIIDIPARNPEATLRVHIDRVFTMKGTGTVVTGSLVAGKVVRGQEIMVYPQCLKSRIRQIQIFSELREEAVTPTRVGMNLSRVRKNQVMRGNVISVEDGFLPTYLLDVAVEVLPDTRLRSWARVRVYIGSSETLGRIVVLGRNQIEPGETGFCQIRLEKELIASLGDRFVFRDYSPSRLLGGGTVLDFNPEKHGHKADILESLKVRSEGDIRQILVSTLKLRPRKLRDLEKNLSLAKKVVTENINPLIDSDQVRKIGEYFVLSEELERLKQKCLAILKEFYRRNPLKVVMSKESLRQSAEVEGEVLDAIITEIPDVEIMKGGVKLKDAQQTLTVWQKRQQEELERLLYSAGFNSPSTKKLSRKYDSEILYALVRSGILVKLTEDIVLHKDRVNQARDLIVKFIQENGKIVIGEIKDVLRTSRRFAVPLAEYLDSQGVTKRVGDYRIIGGGG